MVPGVPVLMAGEHIKRESYPPCSPEKKKREKRGKSSKKEGGEKRGPAVPIPTAERKDRNCSISCVQRGKKKK